MNRNDSNTSQTDQEEFRHRLITGLGDIEDAVLKIDTSNDSLVEAVVDIASKWRTDTKELPLILKRDWEQIEESIAVYNDHAAKIAKVVAELSDEGSADIFDLDSRIVRRLSRSHLTCPEIKEDGTYGPRTCLSHCWLRLFASEMELAKHRELKSPARHKKRKTIESPLPDSESPLPDYESPLPDSDIADK
jgi:hypothetical protein